MRTPMKLFPLLRGSPFAFPLAALAALAMFVISEASYQTRIGVVRATRRAARSRAGEIQTLWRSLTDAETGQRGYLLTNRKEYLKPYVTGQAQATRSLAWLNRYYAAEPGTQALMAQVTQAARRQARRAGRDDPAARRRQASRPGASSC